MNEFKSARIKLAIWYILISIAMLTIFSLAAISAEKRAFGRIQAVLSNKVERPRLTLLLEQRIDNFETDFLRRLLIFDILLLGFSTGASWFLSGKTLKPIAEMVQQQEAFAADVSHELRTPLTTVNMEIEAVKRTTSQMPKAYVSVFDSIQEEIKRMTSLIEGLLLTVRTSKQPITFATVNLSNIVTHTSAKLALLAKEKQIQYTSNIDRDIRINGDSDALNRVLTILIDNAICYTPKKGTITVSLTKSGNIAVLSVADTGIGIAEIDIPYIFERFYRASSHYSLPDQIIKRTGTGLGLSIAKQMLEQHRGTISVTSEKNKGSTFNVHLPLGS